MEEFFRYKCNNSNEYVSIEVIHSCLAKRSAFLSHIYLSSIRDKVENTDWKNQIKLKRCLKKHKVNASSWFYNVVLFMKINYIEIQVIYEKVVGNAYYHNDLKMNRILKR